MTSPAFNQTTTRFDVIGISSAIAVLSLVLPLFPGYFYVVEHLEATGMAPREKLPIITRMVVSLGDPWIGVCLAVLLLCSLGSQFFLKTDRARAIIGALVMLAVIVTTKLANYALNHPGLDPTR